MEDKNCITSEFLWKDWKPRLWIPALSLPSLLWARPFLLIMGFPTAIVEQPDVWNLIYTQALNDYNQRMEPFAFLGGDEHTLRQMNATQSSLTIAFQKLANQLGKSTTVDLERWVRRHFLTHEIEVATRCWMFVLQTACYDTDSEHISPPASLLPILPEIIELMYYGIYGSEYVIKNMRPLTTEELEQNKGQFIWNTETHLVYKAIQQELTIRALKIIAKTLNEQERQEFLAWAFFQAEAIGVTKGKNLCGEKYLQLQPPLFDFPSVLDFPAYIQ